VNNSLLTDGKDEVFYRGHDVGSIRNVVAARLAAKALRTGEPQSYGMWRAEPELSK
jgi:hypothetical protein